ncbi:hypothetical protein V7S57_24315 [Caulobacter sp. CCNWLY153]|uniref:hypothetical protein n=1 Tax=unclassified Caulobacter TaxID=2648921 RepID=UPI002FF05D83
MGAAAAMAKDEHGVWLPGHAASLRQAQHKTAIYFKDRALGFRQISDPTESLRYTIGDKPHPDVLAIHRNVTELSPHNRETNPAHPCPTAKFYSATMALAAKPWRILGTMNG